MTISIKAGHHWEYLTRQVAKGRENYYTKSVDQGEPAGIWQGRAAAELGLTGEVDDLQMAALYGEFVDPSAPQFAMPPETWADAPKLGNPPRTYKSPAEILDDLLERNPDASPEVRERLRIQAQKMARNPVAFLDITFSPAKSVSILHTAFRARASEALRRGDTMAAAVWSDRAEVVEEAMWRGNNAALELLQAEAGYSRVGYHGDRGIGRWVDAHDWVIASFRHSTSRAEQPQLHIHNAVLNRVKCPDGKWRTLDSNAVHKVRAAAGAVAERVMEEDLTAKLGVRFAMRPDGLSREVVGISQQARDLFSARARQIPEKLNALVAEFHRMRGREPNALELYRLSKRAVLATRPKKFARTETNEQRVRRWMDELRREVDENLADIAEAVLDRLPDPQRFIDAFDPRRVIEAAIADVRRKKEKFTRWDLMRAINNHLPDCLGAVGPQRVRQLLDRLARRAEDLQPGQILPDLKLLRLAAPEPVRAPDELRRSDGRSIFEPPTGPLLATAGQLKTEDRLRSAAREVGAAAIGRDVARRALLELKTALAADGRQLGVDQAAVLAGVLTSGRRLEAVRGPAGAGKSFTVATLADLWQQRVGGSVVGLATAQKAANVLKEEGLDKALNIKRWLQAQQRLATGHAAPSAERWRLGQRDLLIVDEAGMASTDQIAHIYRYARGVGAKVLLVGDDRQLPAVGAAGAFRLIASAAQVYELSDVRRFAQPWERAASLRLRDGDQEVLGLYDRHGRIVDAGAVEDAERAAARAWLADHLGGRRSLIVVDTNEQAARVSAAVRADLVGLGQVELAGVQLADGNVAGRGDLIQARRNQWRLRDGQRRPVINREMYQVLRARPDGSLLARRLEWVDGRATYGQDVVMPAAYVAAHTTLGYAVTVHGAQGATVDTCHSVLSRLTSAPALYVQMTRAVHANVGYVVTREVDERSPDDVRPDDRPAKQVHRPPLQVLADVLARHESVLSATEYIERELRESNSLKRLGAMWSECIDEESRVRLSDLLAGLASEGLLTSAQHREMFADDATASLGRLLRNVELSGRDPAAVLVEAVQQRELESADSVSSVLYDRLAQRIARLQGGVLVPLGDSYAERTPTDPRTAYGRYARRLAGVMDERMAALGDQVVVEQPTWALQRLGPVPDEPLSRGQWSTRAAAVQAYREQYSLDDDRDAIGPCPPAGKPEGRAAWHAAWRALGSPENDREQGAMNVAELRSAIEAYERAEVWAPTWVGDQLRVTASAAREYRQHAVLLAVEARVQPEAGRRTEMLDVAAGYEAMAADLDRQHARLLRLDAARAQWHEATAALRDRAVAAREELRLRGVDREAPVPGSDLPEQRAAEAPTAAGRDVATADAATDVPTGLDRVDLSDLADIPADLDDLEVSPETAAMLEDLVRDSEELRQRVTEASPSAPAADESVASEVSLDPATWPADVPELADTLAATERAIEALQALRARRAADRAERDVEQRPTELDEDLDREPAVDDQGPVLDL